MTAPVRSGVPAQLPSGICWIPPQKHGRTGASHPVTRRRTGAAAGVPRRAMDPGVRRGLLMKTIFSKVGCLAATDSGLPMSLHFYLRVNSGRMIDKGTPGRGAGTRAKVTRRRLPSASTVSLCNANFRRIRLGETT